MKDRILLTGSNGFLGRIIFNHLTEMGNDVATINRSNGSYNFDLGNSVPQIRDKYNIVIHAAGKAHELSNSPNAGKDFYKTNFVGTLNLLKGLERSGLPEKFVFISSVSVYGIIYRFILKGTIPSPKTCRTRF
jgi:nucleoside-diphosphate-sugar epimerase